jgi:hypothetical protein
MLGAGDEEMTRRNWATRKAWIVALAVAVGALSASAQTSEDALRHGFENPPDSARPRVWWHWMNGNVTKQGIQADLEWMKRAGIAGFQNFDASLATPQIVKQRLIYMTPPWKDAFRYATTLADQLGLERAIAGSPGWSESGGPWVPPAQAMKKLVWSETWVSGGHPFAGTLPKPPSTMGPFQNVPRLHSLPLPEFYADAAVVAYRAPDGDAPMADLKPKVTWSGGAIDPAMLTDGDLARTVSLPPAPDGGQSWIQYDFGKPQTIRAVSFGSGIDPNPLALFVGTGNDGPDLLASDDGTRFRPVVRLPSGGAAEHTLSFPAVTARFFRLSFGPLPGGSGGELAEIGLRTRPANDHKIAEFILYPAPRVNRFEDKAGFWATPGLYALATPAFPSSESVPKAGVIDLTSRMHSDGTLTWTPPPGRWVILRFGYSLTGAYNSPASPEATGLEVDKLSRPYVRAYFDNYLGQYEDTVDGLMGKRGLQYMITDSWEAGVQNWTDDMMAEFGKRRGYDMRPWMPVLAGRIVESAQASDRFLWDFRRTIAELTAENHYDQLTTILHERGMGRYSESHESGRAFIADGMEVKRTADIPMSAMWTPRSPTDTRQISYDADIRESASVAHIYGQNLVAAESLTAIGHAWSWSPETLKPTADRELAMGLNRFVIHTSVHQPTDDKIPGLGLGPFGQWFTRHETWAELAKAWTTYLARSSYLLQQGRFVADVIYYYGEDSNITALFGAAPPPIPPGYNFDYVNAEALKTRLSVQDGRIVTPTGMSYRLLALDPNSRHMSLGVLRKIRDLVEAGAVVVGPKPVDSPSLADDQVEFHAIAGRLWGRGVGKGKVYGGRTIAQALAALAVQPDFEYTRPRSGTDLLFVHRKLSDGDLYWVDNRHNRAETLDATFRVQGRAPELWHADTGVIEPASYRIAAGRTTVPLRLEPDDAVFVVFREAAAAPSRTLRVPVETTLATVEGPWEVAFQPNRGAPAGIRLDTLISWSDSPDAGVKYFSGTGTYTKTIQAPADWFQSGARLWLDLGAVKNLAQVSVNGRPLGVLWKTPFRADITAALKPGGNAVEIKVTNLWVNRLIGDRQPGISRKYTYTTQPFYQADSPLLPSGLLGPVEIVRSE